MGRNKLSGKKELLGKGIVTGSWARNEVSGNKEVPGREVPGSALGFWVDINLLVSHMAPLIIIRRFQQLRGVSNFYNGRPGA